VQASRAAVALTEKTGAVIDHANSTTMRPNVAVMQRLGKVKTTLSEARNRADNVIIFSLKS
jgi:formylmethanofuran dehydrogenase subunit B